MIHKLTYYVSENCMPYENLAIEQFLATHVEEDECLLFLWQNDHTVVVGRNQNCWKECHVSLLESENGFLARRLSGGGAVYHDMGNLNFTFCTRSENCDLDKQLEVILSAVHTFGINAKKSGRNDIITKNGRKFSGNAFWEKAGFCYHHGTLLINTDREMMNRYLNVSREKLEAKGIMSVRSRVINLTDLCPAMTVDMMKKAIIEGFEKIYGQKAYLLEKEKLDWQEISDYRKNFETWQWKYGRKASFNHKMQKKYPWGEIAFEFLIKNGRIENVNIYSDAMEQTFLLKIAENLKGCRYVLECMRDILVSCADNDKILMARAKDMTDLFKENI